MTNNSGGAEGLPSREDVMMAIDYLRGVSALGAIFIALIALTMLQSSL